MIDLPNDIETLKALIRELLEDNARLKAELAELRRRWGPDSGNSHKPPSSDGYQKKTVNPGLPKEKKHPPGGPVGHQGNPLKRIEHPDHKHLHAPVAVSVAVVHSTNRKLKSSQAGKYLICELHNWTSPNTV